MFLLLLSLLLLALAAIPAALFCSNQRLFRRATKFNPNETLSLHQPVSVLVPARNEQLGIRAALEAILANEHAQFELIVLDDASSDSTAEIVREVARQDQRLRLVASQILPSGWNGKQHACWQLAQAAQFEWLLFLDADVRLSQHAIARVQATAMSLNTDLLSGFPHQHMRTLAEKILIPLMHFILLGYLPIARMRASRKAEFAAGCGQLFLARREPYFACGGHRAIQASRHDGISLPRTFRRHGLLTDIFDASDIASCRMYRSTSEVVRGLLKNATEGIAHPKVIVPLSLLLLGGAVMPAVALGLSLILNAQPAVKITLGVATVLSYMPRVLAAICFRQSWIGALLHPIGVAWFVSLQWLALALHIIGRPIHWRGQVGV